MRAILRILLSLVITNHMALADVLMLSGTIPDRGFALKNDLSSSLIIEPNFGSELKIFISEIRPKDRNIASIDSINKKHPFVRNWVKINNPLVVTASSYIRVEAPWFDGQLFVN